MNVIVGTMVFVSGIDVFLFESVIACCVSSKPYELRKYKCVSIIKINNTQIATTNLSIFISLRID